MKIPPATVGRGHRRLKPAVLRKMLDQGQSISEVGAFFGVSKQRVLQITGPVNRPNGERFRCPAQRRKINKNLSRIDERLRKGESLASIARDLKVGISALSRMTDVRRAFKYKEHGDLGCYRRGCRCQMCMRASANHTKQTVANRKRRNAKRKGV